MGNINMTFWVDHLCQFWILMNCRESKWSIYRNFKILTPHDQKIWSGYDWEGGGVHPEMVDFCLSYRLVSVSVQGFNGTRRFFCTVE